MKYTNTLKNEKKNSNKKTRSNLKKNSNKNTKKCEMIKKPNPVMQYIQIVKIVNPSEPSTHSHTFTHTNRSEIHTQSHKHKICRQ